MDRLAFLKDRQRGIGGSDIPRIFGLTTYSNALDVYHEKTRPIDEEDDDVSIDLLRGREHEPNAVRWYWERTGRSGRAELGRISVNSDYPAFRCHTDGTIFADVEREPDNPDDWRDPRAIKETGTLEIKCPRASVFRRVWESGMRQSELVQAYTYFAVERRSWGSVCYYSMEHEAGPVLVVDLEADGELGKFILEAGQRFWDEHVVPRVPPDPEEWSLIGRTDVPEIKEVTGERVETEDPEIEEAVRDVLESTKIVKDAEYLLDAHKKHLTELLKDSGHDKIRVPGVAKVSRVAVQGRKSFQKDALRKHRPVDRDKLVRAFVDGLPAFDSHVEVEAFLASVELDIHKFERVGDPYEFVRTTPEKGKE